MRLNAITLICILLLIGAVGKSAQIGSHTWSPDAMEGPTPVSASIHAATMVTAGVFMIARCSQIRAIQIFPKKGLDLSFLLLEDDGSGSLLPYVPFVKRPMGTWLLSRIFLLVGVFVRPARPR
ncbi:NADH-ubiquinone oxidoreductase chain 5 (Fragment) [Linum perenne]